MPTFWSLSSLLLALTGPPKSARIAQLLELWFGKVHYPSLTQHAALLREEVELKSFISFVHFPGLFTGQVKSRGSGRVRLTWVDP